MIDKNYTRQQLGEIREDLRTKLFPRYCFDCLPPKKQEDHRYYKGVIIHERVDCPEGMLYMLNEV